MTQVGGLRARGHAPHVEPAELVGADAREPRPRRRRRLHGRVDELGAGRVGGASSAAQVGQTETLLVEVIVVVAIVVVVLREEAFLVRARVQVLGFSSVGRQQVALLELVGALVFVGLALQRQVVVAQHEHVRATGLLLLLLQAGRQTVCGVGRLLGTGRPAKVLPLLLLLDSHWTVEHRLAAVRGGGVLEGDLGRAAGEGAQRGVSGQRVRVARAQQGSFRRLRAHFRRA